MCIKCILIDLITKVEEQLAMEEQLATPTQAPGQTEGPTNPVVYPSDEQAQVDLNHTKALVNSANADALHKLAQAAKWLYDANFQKEAKQVVNQLVSLLPASPDKAKEPEPVKAEEPATVAMPGEPVPQELTDLVNQMRAAGFEVDLVRIPL